MRRRHRLTDAQLLPQVHLSSKKARGKQTDQVLFFLGRRRGNFLALIQHRQVETMTPLSSPPSLAFVTLLMAAHLWGRCNYLGVHCLIASNYPVVLCPINSP